MSWAADQALMRGWTAQVRLISKASLPQAPAPLLLWLALFNLTDLWKLPISGNGTTCLVEVLIERAIRGDFVMYLGQSQSFKCSINSGYSINIVNYVSSLDRMLYWTSNLPHTSLNWLPSQIWPNLGPEAWWNSEDPGTASLRTHHRQKAAAVQ